MNETNQIPTSNDPKYDGQGGVGVNPNMPILSSSQLLQTHAVASSSEVSPFKRTLSYGGQETKQETEAGVVPMGETDKVVHLSVDDPDNSDEGHLRSVEDSADSLAID